MLVYLCRGRSLILQSTECKREIEGQVSCSPGICLILKSIKNYSFGPSSYPHNQWAKRSMGRRMNSHMYFNHYKLASYREKETHLSASSFTRMGFARVFFLNEWPANDFVWGCYDMVAPRLVSWFIAHMPASEPIWAVHTVGCIVSGLTVHHGCKWEQLKWKISIKGIPLKKWNQA